MTLPVPLAVGPVPLGPAVPLGSAAWDLEGVGCSKGGRFSLLMSTLGFEGVPVRKERFSGVMWTPDGENPLSSVNSLPPPYLWLS